MALGTLARYGPQHGHQIRRLADLTNVGEWGGVSVGALYRELRAMEGEGLVETVRTEQVGRRPARTVYEITGDGRIELQSLREQAIKPTGFGPDALGVALTFAAEGMDPAELRDTLRARRNRLEISAVELAAELERLTGQGVPGRVPGGDHAARRDALRGRGALARRARRGARGGARATRPPCCRARAIEAGMRGRAMSRPPPLRPHLRRTKQQKPSSRYYLNSIEILLDTDRGSPSEPTRGSNDHADHRGQGPRSDVHEQETDRARGARGRSHRRAGRDRRLPWAERGGQDHHPADAHHAAAAHGRHRHRGRGGPAPQPAGGAAADRVRAAGDRADDGRHRPGVPGLRGAARPGGAVPDSQGGRGRRGPRC